MDVTLVTVKIEDVSKVELYIDSNSKSSYTIKVRIVQIVINSFLMSIINEIQTDPIPSIIQIKVEISGSC